jgi:uncharacterized protein YkwD
VAKKSKSSVKKTKKSSSKWNISPKAIVLAGVVVFGIIGAYFISASSADRPKDYDKSPNNVVLEVRSEKSIIIDEVTPQVGALSLRIYGDGSIICYNNQKASYLQGALTAGQVQSSLNSMYDTGVTRTKAKTINGSPEAAVGNFTSVMINASNKKYKNEYHSGAKPIAYDKVDSVVGELCQYATEAVTKTTDFSPSSEASEPVEVDTMQAFLDKLFPTAHAMTMYTLGNDNFDEINNINETRANRSKGRLFANECLTKVATAQARRMAEKNKLYHNPELKKDINAECNLGASWGIGENVGYVGPCDYQGYDDCEKRMFKTYMDSDDHRRNLLNDDWKYVGVGSYRTSTGTLWTAQVFGRCAPYCTAKWNNGIPRVNTGANVTNLNDGQTVKPGDMINVRVSFKNYSNSGRLVDSVDGKIKFQGIVPNGTSVVSINNSPGLYKISNGVVSDPQHTHDLKYPVKRISWEFSKVAPDGSPGSEWEASYQVSVNPGVENGKLLCFHSDIFGGDNNLLTTSDRKEVCHKVSY